ncbi:scapularisin preproprotein-like [Tropilaelaps mercedesae]|uniref:Scapularisin preproprotein-like n=1 Tax=Tropilaelaps mercedesae TaxID=418985 RepID=A0A1V9XTA3_9ACAR|nr:scapularisin preproprotein-like [Tropilaelaps mercedesae]
MRSTSCGDIKWWSETKNRVLPTENIRILTSAFFSTLKSALISLTRFLASGYNMRCAYLLLLLFALIANALAGFGCPFDAQKCHLHCRSIGRLGGYCTGFLRATCVCYNK